MKSSKNNKSFIECFCNFMSDPENLNQEDIKYELEEIGVDTNKLTNRALEIVKKGSKKRRLKWQSKARESRIKIEKIIKSKKAKGVEQDIKNKFMEILSGKHGAPAKSFAEAYFRKMESLSENDLKSILEDMENLDLIDKTTKEN